MPQKSPNRLANWLVRLLPVDVREAHGEELRQVLGSGDHERKRGAIPALIFWCRALIDVLRVAPRQHAEALLQDLRYTARGLRRSPVFALSAIVTITLGIGATLTVFVVVNAVLIRPLPFADPAGIALIWAVTPEGSRTWLSAPEVEDLRGESRNLQDVAGLTDLRLALTGSGAPQELDAAAASASFFPLLGIEPHLGRLPAAEDDVAGAARVVVLSHGLWTRRFGSSPDVLGRAIALDGQAYTVIGVLPRSFDLVPPSSVFPQHADVWVALRPHLVSRARDVRYLHAVGRVRDGITFDALRAELSAIGSALSRNFGRAYGGRTWSFEAVPMEDDVVRGVRPALLVLLGTVAMVLLIAVVNVAALLLARADGRRREMAVRTALGASRGRLLRQLLTEGLVIAAIGGIAGLALALATPALSQLPALSSLPRFSDLSLDWRVGACTVIVVMLTAVLFAVAPALELSGRTSGRANESLRSAARSRAAARVSRWLAAAEVALTAAVLVLALLFARHLRSLLDVDPGFTPTSVVSARVSLPPAYATGASITQFFDRVEHNLRGVAGIESAAAITQLPLSGAMLGSSFAADQPGADARVDADLRGIMPMYFDVMRIPLQRGRGFTAADSAQGLAVAVVDEIAARQLWPGADPIGRRIRWIRQPDVAIEIVGVVAAVRHRGIDQPARATIYRPHTQYPRSTMYLVARTHDGYQLSQAALSAAVTSVDPNQPITEVTTMDALRTRSFAAPGFGAALGSALAMLALTLTAVGVYGVYAFTVGQRRRELGVRLAVGGTPARIERLILKDALQVAVIGLSAGLPTAIVAARWVRGFVPGAAATDPATLAAAAILAIAVALAACWIPARRASRVDPTVVLRAEP
jgi:putative ABC transport system permease protein